MNNLDGQKVMTFDKARDKSDSPSVKRLAEGAKPIRGKLCWPIDSHTPNLGFIGATLKLFPSWQNRLELNLGYTRLTASRMLNYFFIFLSN